MSRILVVAPDLPHPPYTGGHLRPLSLMRALARHHEVIAVGAAAPDADLAPLRELCLAVRCLHSEPYRRGPGRSVLSKMRRTLTPVPLIARSNWGPLGALVDDAVAEFRPEAIQLETMYSMHYRRPPARAVLDLSDVVSGLCDAALAAHPWRFAAARWQRRDAERVERERLSDFDAVLTINEADSARLFALGMQSDMVPLAVRAPRYSAPSNGGGSPLRLLFVGSFEHSPNRQAARFIAAKLVPALSQRGAAAHVVLAGRDASSLAPDVSGVDAPGVTIEMASDVPDLAPLYESAHVVIAPLAFGGGTKNKTLEAMAWARPVVGSPQAFTGIPPELRDAAYVQTPMHADLMAGALERLAADADGRARIGAAGRAYVLEHHTQERVDAAVDAVYERVLNGGAPARTTRP